jgi:hypothetical protein
MSLSLSFDGGAGAVMLQENTAEAMRISVMTDFIYVYDSVSPITISLQTDYRVCI